MSIINVSAEIAAQSIKLVFTRVLGPWYRPDDLEAGSNLRATLLGFMLPVATSLLAVAFLWGSGVRILDVEQAPGAGPAGGFRQAVAWLAAIFLIVLAAYALLPWMRNLFWYLSGAGKADLRAREKVEERYGLNMRVVWPRLTAVLPTSSITGIAKCKSRVISAESAAVGWLLIGGGTAGLVYVAHRPWLGTFFLVVSLALAGSSAVRLVHAARDLAQVREVTVDLHRFRLLQAMHMPLPRTTQEEFQWNTVISEVLLGQERRQRGMIYTHPSDGDLAAVSTGRLRTALSEALETVVSEPPLFNFSGWVGATVEDAKGVQVQFQDGSAQVSLGGQYRLQVLFSDKRPQGIAAERLEVLDGTPVTEVPFRIEIDSPTVRFPRIDYDVMVSASVPHSAVAVDFYAPAEGGSYPLWVQILQSTRLLQVVLLTLEAGKRDTPETRLI